MRDIVNIACHACTKYLKALKPNERNCSLLCLLHFSLLDRWQSVDSFRLSLLSFFSSFVLFTPRCRVPTPVFTLPSCIINVLLYSLNKALSMLVSSHMYRHSRLQPCINYEQCYVTLLSLRPSVVFIIIMRKRERQPSNCPKMKMNSRIETKATVIKVRITAVPRKVNVD